MADEVHGDSPPDTGGFFTSPEAGRLELAIQGQAIMDISTPAPLRDGSYRIVLSPGENWVIRSFQASGLDSSMEIELILGPTI